MADINKRGPDCDDDDGERGERGKRGKRGQRGHDGHDGKDGPPGPPVVGEEQWVRVSDMATPRAWHSLVSLPNGQALVMGGWDAPKAGAPALASAEVFDAGSDTWAPVANMPVARGAFAAHPLPVGKVLVCCGRDPLTFNFSDALTSSYVFDYVTEAWTAAAGIPVTNNYRPTCDPIPLCIIRGGFHDGDPLTVNGMGFEDPDTSFFRFGGTKSGIRFDLNTNTWVPIAQAPIPRAWAAGIVPLGNGKVLVAGGISYLNGPPGLPPFHPDQATNLCHVYDADLDIWTAVDPMPEIVGEMSGAYPIVAPGGSPVGYQARRILGAGVPLGAGRALIIGGLGPVALDKPASGPPFVPCRPRATCWIFDLNKLPGTQWRQTGSMEAGRCWPTAFTLDSGEIVVCGGTDELWSPGSYLTEIFDPDTETWRRGPDLPLNMPQPPGAQRPDPIFTGHEWYQATELTNGQVLMAGSQQHNRMDEVTAAIFFGPGTIALAVAAKFVPGTPAPGTPPGTPLAPASVDAAMAGFLNFPFA